MGWRGWKEKWGEMGGLERVEGKVGRDGWIGEGRGGVGRVEEGVGRGGWVGEGRGVGRDGWV